MKRFIYELLHQLCVLLVFFTVIIYKRFIDRVSFTRDSKGDEKNKSLLIISFYSPPYRSVAGTQRTSKFIKYLSRLGWDITLLTTYPYNLEVQDPSGEKIPDNVDVVRIKPVIAWSMKEPVPDRYIVWIFPALITALKLVRSKKISVVYATAPPYSNLIAATLCSILTRSPLILDFRDPWSRIVAGEWVLNNKLLKKINERLELEVLRCASRVLMVVRYEYVDEYFITTDHGIKDKIVSIANGYDEEDFDSREMHSFEKCADKFTISYVGSLYDIETVMNILTPLQEWYNSRPDDFSRVVFVYAGPNSDYLKKYSFMNLTVEDHGYVSHTDAIGIRYKSDIQIFSQPSTFKPHVLSGKIFEMIRVGVPILAVTNPNGAVAKLLQATGAGFVAVQENPCETAILFKKLFDDWNAHGFIKFNIEDDVVKTYSRESQAQHLANLLDEVIS